MSETPASHGIPTAFPWECSTSTSTSPSTSPTPTFPLSSSLRERGDVKENVAFAEPSSERELEQYIVSTLSPRSSEDIDLGELRLLLPRFEKVDVRTETYRLGQWVDQKGEPLKRPLRMLESWLARAPTTDKRGQPRSKRLATPTDIAAYRARRKAFYARQVEWRGDELLPLSDAEAANEADDDVRRILERSGA